MEGTVEGWGREGGGERGREGERGRGGEGEREREREGEREREREGGRGRNMFRVLPMGGVHVPDSVSHQSREQSLSYLSEAGGSHSCLRLCDRGLGSPLLLCLPRLCCLHVP